MVFRAFLFFFTVIDTFSQLSWSLEEATCENVIDAKRPDIITMKKKANKCITVDIAIPGDCRIIIIIIIIIITIIIIIIIITVIIFIAFIAHFNITRYRKIPKISSRAYIF